jgi:translation initiation factor IF-2
MTSDITKKIPRPPVVAVMGHIDHGKSTLLSCIRKCNQPLNEAGGITQHVSAYEVIHKSSDGKDHKITFIDTPGHAAFFGIRKRGANIADVAVLVVSAEDGVKPQTTEALRSIISSKIPYIVAINKIDKPEANVERTKQSLAENEIYVEGYGGTVPVAFVSAATGEGVPELLDMIILISEMEEFSGNPDELGSGIVVESNRDQRKGNSALCIIKNGTVKKGQFAVSGKNWSPIRIIENFEGKNMETAMFSSPIRIFGWDNLPDAGEEFKIYSSRDEAISKAAAFVDDNKNGNHLKKNQQEILSEQKMPIILKADTVGSLEAAIAEISKLTNDKIAPKIISSGIGTITENDVRLSHGENKAVIIGFGVSIDAPARSLAERSGARIETFDIIYKLSEWVAAELSSKIPKEKIEESTGLVKILKVFSKVKDRQIVGGRVEKGSVKKGSLVKILRREIEIGRGKIRELQQEKRQTDEVSEGVEFGAMIEAKIEIAPGDKIESFTVTEK